MSKQLYVAVSPAGKIEWETMFSDKIETQCRLLNLRGRSWMPMWEDFAKRGWTVRKCKIVLTK